MTAMILSEEEASLVKEQFGYFMTGKSIEEDNMFLSAREMDAHTDSHVDGHSDSGC